MYLQFRLKCTVLFFNLFSNFFNKADTFTEKPAVQITMLLFNEYLENMNSAEPEQYHSLTACCMKNIQRYSG
jgi:hypothetical protein